MKNKLIGIVALLLIAIGVMAFIPREKKDNPTEDRVETGIDFIEQNWKEALEKARKENKLVFLDAYASWCGPCKMLKRNTFSKKEAGDYFNEHFINVAVDMEQGEGPALGMKYAVDAYPTLIVTDAAGNLITYTKGYMDARQLIAFGKYAIDRSKKTR